MESTKFKRTELPKVKKELIKRQGGLCPICNGDLTRIKPCNVVVDHDHSTGVVRAALHRGCNGVEGKVYRLVSTWGKASGLAAVIKVLENLVNFWKLHRRPQTEWIYWDHKTAAEKRVALNKKRRLATARRKKK